MPEIDHASGQVLPSQNAFRANLLEYPDSQYYDPFLPKQVIRSTSLKYRQLIQETNGTSSPFHDWLITETRNELIKSGNNGIGETVEKADGFV